MTYGEILDSIKSYRKREENKLKERALMDFKLAQCISKNVSCLASEENTPADFFEIYKELFKEENKERERQLALNELEINKQRMLDFVNFHNKNMRKEDK